MTTCSDKAARQAKAAQLRENIAHLTKGSTEGDAANTGQARAIPNTTTATNANQAVASPTLPSEPAASPRDFIARRMRELAAKKK